MHLANKAKRAQAHKQTKKKINSRPSSQKTTPRTSLRPKTRDTNKQTMEAHVEIAAVHAVFWLSHWPTLKPPPLFAESAHRLCCTLHERSRAVGRSTKLSLSATTKLDPLAVTAGAVMPPTAHRESED